MEGLFEVFAGFGFVAEAGVALLDFGEEALFGGEEEAGAVGVDAAAFEDEAVGFASVSGSSISGLNSGMS